MHALFSNNARLHYITANYSENCADVSLENLMYFLFYFLFLFMHENLLADTISL